MTRITGPPVEVHGRPGPALAESLSPLFGGAPMNTRTIAVIALVIAVIVLVILLA
jgi:hypothetical protein